MIKEFMETAKERVAKLLLEAQAVKLQPNAPFTWASGWKSPIYCDNRVTLAYPEIRSVIKEELAKAVMHLYPEVDVIAAVATGAIAQGSLVADLLNKPFAYIRSTPKDHGMENLIEGRIQANENVLIIEDLISTGGSSLKAARAVKAIQANVLGMIAVYTHGFALAEEAFHREGIALHTLTDYDSVIQEALRIDYIKASDVELLKEWRKDPAHWGKELG